LSHELLDSSEDVDPIRKSVVGRCARSWLYRFLLVWVCVAWILAPTVQAFSATAGAILATPERYDKQVVTPSGAVTKLNQRVSQRGNAYYSFDLQDATGRIRVFSFGQATCPEGREATVEGTFDTVKRVGGYTFYNEVTASRVMCR
jgi:hypothetical protein